ncbi:MAG: ribonuclease HII [Firmicutes bacterium]|nr:ribonuclease HII [Bacillota bacterium]
MRGETKILNEKERARLEQLHFHERLLWKSGVSLIAGVDEVGRGPLAGPLVAAAVVIERELMIPGLNDSKSVPPSLRTRLAQEIKRHAKGWGIGIVPVGFIERYNIHQATFYAMKLALERLPVPPDHVLIDGWALPDLIIPQTPLVKGDARSAAIAAASLLAKTLRDEIMIYYSRIYPRYGFEKNKGYATPAHLEALRKYGPCFLHRFTFCGVKVTGDGN